MSDNQKEIKNISPEHAKHLSLQPEVLVIDVREPSEYREGHIEGSLNIPLGKLCIDETMLLNHKDKTLILHCKSGARSRVGCEKLLQQGIGREVFNLEGGIDKWASSGMPVAKDDSKTAMCIERQMHLIIASVILVTLILGIFVSSAFFLIQILMAASLLASSLFGLCLARKILLKMPWNKTDVPCNFK